MSEKLLIVEDDKKLNDGIRLALKNDAYFFYQCRTLQEAREILKKEDITLVLLDVNLPDGNGIDFVREIRKNTADRIIVESTGTSTCASYKRLCIHQRVSQVKNAVW